MSSKQAYVYGTNNRRPHRAVRAAPLVRESSEIHSQNTGSEESSAFLTVNVTLTRTSGPALNSLRLYGTRHPRESLSIVSARGSDPRLAIAYEAHRTIDKGVRRERETERERDRDRERETETERQREREREREK